MSQTTVKMAKPKGEAVEPPTKSKPREYTEAILVALFFALLLRTFVVQAFRIPTGSMKDTLLVGDFLLVNKFIYGARTPDGIPWTDITFPVWRLPTIREPQAGDIVVFKYPRDPKLDYIKRCIAVGGQTVEMRDGVVYIDGKPEGEKEFIKEEYDAAEGHAVRYYKITRPTGQIYTIRNYAEKPGDYYGPITVPPGQFFMMGDNRDNSQDSRYWDCLPRENVVGQALIIYFSVDTDKPWLAWLKNIRWGRIGNSIK